MAKRYNLPFTSLPILGSGEAWEVDFYDSQFVGTAVEIDGDESGFVLDYEGKADMPDAILPSSATFSVLIESAAGMSIVNDIAGAAEGRFFAVIRRSGSANAYWAGYVHAGNCTYPDNYYPFHFEVFSTDGLARLKDIDYVDDDGSPYTGTATLLEHVVNILSKIDVTSVGTWPTARIRSTANLFSEDMNLTTCPLNQATLVHERFTSRDREGNAQAWSCYAVLDDIMKVMGCQIRLENGMWQITSLNAYSEASQTAYYYQADGTFISSAVETLDREVDYATSTGMKKGSGGQYAFNNGLKSVCVDYHHLTSSNRATGLGWSNSSNGWKSVPMPLYVDADDTTQLEGVITVKHRSTIGIVPPGSAAWPTHRLVFQIQVRISYATSWLYLERSVSAASQDFNATPEQLVWGGDPDEYQAWSIVVNEADNGQDKFSTFKFTTPYIPTASIDTGAQIEMRVYLDRLENLNGQTLVLSGSPYQGATPWQTDSVVLRAIGEGTGPNPDNETIRYCAETSGDNTEKRMIDIHMADGPAPFSLSTLRVAGVVQSLWKVRATGTGLTLAKQLAAQALRFRKVPQAIYRGDFIHPAIKTTDRFVNDDVAYMAVRLRFDAFSNRWNGEFVVMDGDVDGITTPTEWVPPIDPDGRQPGLPGIPPLPPPPDPTPDTGFPDPDGIMGGQGGYIAQSEAAVTVLTDDVVAASNPTISIEAVGHVWAKKGDSVKIIHPGTGVWQELAVAATPTATATSISLSGTLAYDMPVGALVKLTSKVQSQRLVGWSYMERNVTGGSWAIPNPNTTNPTQAGTGGQLPSPSSFDTPTLRERVKVWRSGNWLIYDANSFDNSFGIKPGTNEIEFHMPLSGEDVMVVVN